MSDMPPLQAGAVAVARETAHSGHVVQFYENPSFLLDQLSRFVGTALGAGDAAIVIARKAIRDGLTQRLKARGIRRRSGGKSRPIHRVGCCGCSVKVHGQ
jgi:hypothetical protein